MLVLRTSVYLIWFGISAFLLISYATASQRPRGVPFIRSSLYARNGDTWQCLDHSEIIKYEHINDDYCDCPDGSDEPGTSACAKGEFYCENIGYKGEFVPSSRVNDGICDCCDGSDEYDGLNGTCADTCLEVGAAAERDRQRLEQINKEGGEKRQELIEKAKQQHVQREKRLMELDQQLREQKALESEKREHKEQAELFEKEALDAFNEKHGVQTTPSPALDNSKELVNDWAQANFTLYDTNQNNLVEIAELQVDLDLDKNGDGVVSIEEAKFILDEHESVDLKEFVSSSFARIQAIKRLTTLRLEHHDQQNEDERDRIMRDGEKLEASENVPHAEDVEQGQPDHSDEDIEDFEEDDREEEHEEDADVGVGHVSPEEKPENAPEYDPATEYAIEQAKEARNVHAEIEQNIREIEREIKEIQEQNDKDYGPQSEFATLDGECYKLEDSEYIYTLCPFDRASQQPRSGGAETTLGRWGEWSGKEENKYKEQKYSNGASCWNGPNRSATVQIGCALETKLTAVSEPNRCEYFFEFETPAACDSAELSEHTRHEEL